jgi:hypothetical protein
MKFILILFLLISCTNKPKEEIPLVLTDNLRLIEKCNIVNNDFTDTLFFKILRTGKSDIDFRCFGFYEDGNYYFFLKSTYLHRILKKDIDYFYYKRK